MPMPRRTPRSDGAVGAVRRRPRAPQHRARVHHPPRRRLGPRRGAHRPCRWRGRDPQLRHDRRRRRAASRTGSTRRAIQPGDRIAFMLEPSLPFYVCLFGAMQTGAISVPLFTLFGPDALRLRVGDCNPTILITNAEKAELAALGRRPARGRRRRRPARRDRAVSRDLHAEDQGQRHGRVPVHLGHHARAARGGQALAPHAGHADVRRALRHRHPARRRVLLPVIAGLGPRPVARHAGAAGDGRDHRHLRRAVRSGAADAGAGRLRDHQHARGGDALPDDEELRERRATSSSTSRSCPTPASRSTRRRSIGSTRRFKVPACSMYGTTEIGVVLVNYPGAEDFVVKPGSLGKAVPGQKLEVQRADGTPAAPGEIGELMLWRARPLGDHQGPREDRRGRLFLPLRPRRRRDHLGRLDDVRGRDREHHAQAPRRARMRGDRRARRAARPGGQGVRRRQPRGQRRASSRNCRTSPASAWPSTNFRGIVEFVDELPKTPAGKVHRKVLRDREAAAASCRDGRPDQLNFKEKSRWPL